MSFQPEIGQLAFSNGQMMNLDLNRTIEAGLVALAEAVAVGREENPDKIGTLVSNYGCDPFESEVFDMQTYCWCDGDRPGHEDGCPPNFIHHPSGFAVSWYKHVGRGASQNMHMPLPRWLTILGDCLEAAAAPTPLARDEDGLRESVSGGEA